MDLLERWNEGGAGMYPIALAALVGVAIILERTVFLFWAARMNKAALLAGVSRALEQGGLDAALRYVAGQRPAPLTLLVKSALMNAPHGHEEVQAALDEAALRETPRLEARTGYLAMLGNAAMLAGLLGTVSGLIESFRVVAHVEASAKATILSGSISEAMNCTFFGLVVAIPMLVGYSVLMGRTQSLINDMSETSVSLLNLLAKRSASGGGGGSGGHLD